MLRAGLLGTMLLACLICPSACFATTLKDVQIGVRVVDFFADPPPPGSSVAIIFDSQNKDSEVDARNIMTFLSSGLGGGAKTTLLPVLVDVHNLDEAQGVRVGFVASATESGYVAILEFARKHAVVTISSELSCVRAGICTVGIASTPRVEVLVNRHVSEISGVTFTEAFRMLVTEY